MTESATIKVQGMSCDGCAASLTRRLSSEAGVAAASVSLADGEATIEYEPTAVTLDRLSEVVRETGFTPG